MTLVEGLHDELVKTGLLFLVREIGEETGKIHFQGVWHGVESTVRKIIKKYGYKGNGTPGYSVKACNDAHNTPGNSTRSPCNEQK